GSSPSSPVPSKAIPTRTPCRAISDAQLRATVNTNSGNGSAQSGGARTTTKDKIPCSAAKHIASEARHSADNVTAAYTLVQQAAAQKNATSRKTEGRWGTPTTTRSPHRLTAGSEAPLARQGHETNKDSRREPPAISNWSVANIGFNDIKSEKQARIERDNKAGYVRAAFASQVADKPYIAQAAHFRFRYPHTLGRISALSNVRSDRVNARRDRAFTSSDHNYVK
ncbi:unnamed protein product, partial [Ectocarpus fasciculatus]